MFNATKLRIKKQLAKFFSAVALHNKKDFAALKRKMKPVMKKVFIMLLAMAAGLCAVAQSDEVKESDTNLEDKIYSIVEHDPEFPGGMEGLYQWLATNVKYPEHAKENGIQGRVVVKFVIEKDGSVSDVRIMRSPNDELSEEAIRVVKAMPKWKAGRQNGKKVRVQYMLPINFKL